MKLELLKELLAELIESNQKEFDFASSIGVTNQMEYYAGKLAAYGIIDSYLNN